MEGIHGSFCLRWYAVVAGDEKTCDGPKSDKKRHDPLLLKIQLQIGCCGVKCLIHYGVAGVPTPLLASAFMRVLSAAHFQERRQLSMEASGGFAEGYLIPAGVWLNTVLECADDPDAAMFVLLFERTNQWAIASVGGGTAPNATCAAPARWFQFSSSSALITVGITDRSTHRCPGLRSTHPAFRPQSDLGERGASKRLSAPHFFAQVFDTEVVT